jgi:O-antigen/teichoic acid export membrane protein
VSSATFPSLAASYGTDPARFRRLFVMSNVALGLLGVAIAVFLAFAGAPLIAYVFPGKDFTQVGELMPIVAWSTPALLLVHHNVYMFAAANKEDANLRVMGLWFVIITVLQLAIVPSHGVVGAAWALLLARTIGLCLLAVAVVMGGTHRGGKAGA